MSTLHIDSIQKHFGNKCILSDIYLKCNTSEVIGILGRNGCGKSTLFKIIQGSLISDQKFIKVNNEIISYKNNKHKYISYLPQENFLPTHISNKQLINLHINKNRQEEFKNLEAITKIISKKSNELSTGQRRFFEILLILYSDSEFVILDEPFNGLSPKSIEFINELIHKEKQNKGIIISDHDYRNVLSIANKIYFLNDASLKEIKDIEELKKHYIPENAETN